MNAISEIKGMVLNADGVTSRYPGTLQHPMSVDEQKKAGLIATVDVSIHPGKSLAKKSRTFSRPEG